MKSNDVLFKSIVKWITSNTGYSFLTAPSNQFVYYVDLHGVNRAMTYHGAANYIAFNEAVKEYIHWRLEQKENYPEVTFSQDHSIFKINLIEKEYENRM